MCLSKARRKVNWVQEFSPKEYMAAGVLAADKKK
jgi:hypothetical protein